MIEDYSKIILKNINGFIILSDFQKPAEKSFISDGIKEITGYDKSEVTVFAGGLLNIIDKDDIPDVLKAMNDFFNDPAQTTTSIDYRINGKESSTKWINQNIRAIRDRAGKVNLAISTCTDITELKTSELNYKNNNIELKEINKSKDKFINILSHDLRAPFTSILGFAEILLNEENLPQKEKTEYLTYIYEAAQNQLELINYLLDWSRLKTGNLKIQPQRLKASILVYNSISILTANSVKKDIEIQVDIDEEIYIQADERLVNQIFVNLINNAVKFSKPNSKIEVVANYYNEKEIEFIVRDYGVGISQEDQQKLFSIEKAFTRDGTKGEKGTGIGLVLVKEIIEKHGGEIWLYSEKAKGTEIHFTLPIPSNVILIVEGNNSENDELASFFEIEFSDFKMLKASNAYESLVMLQDCTPSLIISNHNMPLMNGLQFVEAIKSGDTSVKVPILIYDESLTSEIELKYIKLGIKSILKKPFNPEEFSKIVKQLLL